MQYGHVSVLPGPATVQAQGNTQRLILIVNLYKIVKFNQILSNFIHWIKVVFITVKLHLPRKLLEKIREINVINEENANHGAFPLNLILSPQ